MSEHVLEEFETLRKAVEFIKGRLKETDALNTSNLNEISALNPSKASKSMEEINWNDKLFLLYSIDGGYFFVFESVSAVEGWLADEAWDSWGLWELNKAISLNEDLRVWEFHRDVCKEMFRFLYRRSKPFIDGWPKKRKKIRFKAVPSFTLD